jgi:hypothetical protein
MANGVTVRANLAGAPETRRGQLEMYVRRVRRWLQLLSNRLESRRPERTLIEVGELSPTVGPCPGEQEWEVVRGALSCAPTVVVSRT